MFHKVYSVATYERCSGMFNIHLTANLLRNIPVKKIVNRLRLDRVMAISRWPRFLWPTLYLSDSIRHLWCSSGYHSFSCRSRVGCGERGTRCGNVFPRQMLFYIRAIRAYGTAAYLLLSQWRGERYDGTSTRTGPLQSKKIN